MIRISCSRWAIGFSAALAAVGLLVVPVSTQDGPYRASTPIVIGGDGGWDYQSIDAVGRRLYVSHQSKIVAVDLDALKVVGEVTGLVETHRLAPAHDLNRGFTSNTGNDTVNIVDLKTMKTISQVAVGHRPDFILYEPGRKEAYSFNDKDHSSSVIDGTSGKVVTTIPLSGAPESAAADPQAGRVYDNIVSANVVDVIDTATHKVVASWPTAPCEGPSSMDIDAVAHRLFIGCRKDTMIMMDSTNGKVLADVPIPPRVDSTAYDPGTHLVFSACLTKMVVARFDAPDKLTVVQTFTTQPRGANVAVDPKTHRIFIASGEPVPNTPRQTPPNPAELLKLVPDSFKVFVWTMDPVSSRGR